MMARLMNTDRTPGGGSRRRALLILGGAGLLVLALLVGVVVSVTSMFTSDGPTPSDPGSSTSGAVPETGAGNGPEAEKALAHAQMLVLPEAASQPHALSTRTAGDPITLPEPTRVVGERVAGGFPDSPEGAIAQLIELTRTGLAGADPQTWAQAYSAVAEPDAAAPEATKAYDDLVGFRRAANVRPTGPLSQMNVSWAPTSALVKGSTDDGSYVVGCVLGEFVAEARGRVVTAGFGNCLPMRRVDNEWRVASGTTAFPAPSPWPGSDEAVAAGYRELQR
ncbi:hypothetical protein [Pseudonocardia sp. EC080610-09]|uniref:hypothetical protein n=1 Tax=Pseudonocardia sp. EC080610-09 TaxID=1688404 RepID=UPI0011AE8CD5|nr:hypothetical protein [Pseudonocardia sp. EC080610-09]